MRRCCPWGGRRAVEVSGFGALVEGVTRLGRLGIDDRRGGRGGGNRRGRRPTCARPARREDLLRDSGSGLGFAVEGVGDLGRDEGKQAGAQVGGGFMAESLG